MGYTTAFTGDFKLDRPMDRDLAERLSAFVQERHDEGGWPGIWCDWMLNNDATAIVWNESEKFYDYVAWLEVLIQKFIGPAGYVLNGQVEWQGEEPDDFGVIDVQDNVVQALRGTREIPKPKKIKAKKKVQKPAGPERVPISAIVQAAGTVLISVGFTNFQLSIADAKALKKALTEAV
jgi:hypothetical protein